ncbi:MAG: DUF2974 domain-containing protein [Lachnospiraceae bacterium]|nr:DUF2974 domain-containing protein [Lachnospiraceae bacterium]
MGNIVSYLEEFGDKTFKEMPFQEVDALVLSQFSYLKFDGLVPKLTDNTQGISLAQMTEQMDEAVVFADERYEKENRLLFEGLLHSRRFGNMVCNYYSSIINEDVETQFCAMTCLLEGELPVVVFRGTDENLVGWKEDFNMAFKKPVPGQKLSGLYINQVGLRIAEDFYVCGHSKGGNLAVYGSMNAFTDIQNRIKRIYSFDGPGFRPEIFSSERYDRVAERIEKYIPRYALVGMIMESHEDYIVVDSSYIGLLQHDPYSWKVEAASFVVKKEVKKSQQFMNEALNEWILKLDDEQLELFVETLFLILEGCEAKNLIEMAYDWRKSLSGMIHATMHVDESTRVEIIEMIHMFFTVVKENLKKL